MLVETWIAVPLRARTQAVIPAGWREGAANWLLEGTWGSAIAEPELGPGGAGAGLYAILKAIDPESRVVLVDGAVAPLDLAGVGPPAAGADPVPPGWESGLVDETARATFEAEGLVAALTGRYASRTRVGVPALRLVVRGVRKDLLPLDGDDPDYDRELVRALEVRGAAAHLRDLLADAGRALGERIARGFADDVAGPVELRCQVRVFERVDGLEEVVRGLPAGAVRQIGVAGSWFAVRRPRIEVVRRGADGTVALWRGEPEEVAVAR